MGEEEPIEARVASLLELRASYAKRTRVCEKARERGEGEDGEVSEFLRSLKVMINVYTPLQCCF